MGKPGAGKKPRTQRDVFRYAKERGGEIVKGGKHIHIRNPRTGDSRPVPGPGDIAPGTLRGIMKWLTLSFALLPLCLVVWLANGLASIY